MKIYKLLLYFLMLLIILNTSCSKEKSLPSISTSSIEQLIIQGSGINYKTKITDKKIIDSIVDWYDHIVKFEEIDYKNTFINDPQLIFQLSNNESVIIQADYPHSELLQIIHVISNDNYKQGSNQIIYRGKSKQLNEFINILLDQKKEKNNKFLNRYEIWRIIRDINMNDA